MSRFDIDSFVQKTSQRDLGEGLFELENDRLLELNLNGAIWTKTGSMVAYLGEMKFEGRGMLAITTHYDPVTLRVTPQQPVFTDPNATVAWSGGLSPEFKTDVSLKTFFGRGSGESLQMSFRGEGFVVIQPYEEVYMQHGN